MNADDVSVLSEMKVTLDGISPELPSKLEGWERILGRQRRSPAMRHEKKGEDELYHLSLGVRAP